MSFLDGSSQSVLLDCSEGDMKPGAWGGTDLLDPGGDAADFDISSFFSQLAASTTAAEAPHGADDLCGSADVSSSALPVQQPDRVGLCDAVHHEEEHAAATADVSLSALLGEHAELQEALLAASEPPSPPTAASKGKTFVIVKKTQHPQPQQQQQRDQQQHNPPDQHQGGDHPEAPARRRRGRQSTPPYGRPPPAPLSAYSIYFKEQYADLKGRWRFLNRQRAVPRLARRWACMTREEKRPYQRRADAEKAEYRTQLAQYRQRARLWRRHRAAAAAAAAGGEGGVTAMAASAPQTAMAVVGMTGSAGRVEERGQEEEERGQEERGPGRPPTAEEEEEEVHSDDDPADLYCRQCDLYFSSSHNKGQHLLSRKHIRKMAREAAARERPSVAAAPVLAAGAPASGDRLVRESSGESESESESGAESADVPDALETVFGAVVRREREIQFLQEFSRRLAERRHQLQLQAATLEARHAEAMTSQTAVTSEHRQLTDQVQGLLLVPTLFGVMSHWGRDAHRAASAISGRHGQLEV